jgi:hypothetical protein
VAEAYTDEKLKNTIELPYIAASLAVTIIALLISIAFYFAYFRFPSTGVRDAVGLSSVIFWVGLWVLLGHSLFRPALKTFVDATKTRLGIAVFLAYVSAHLVLYGFLLEEIFALTLNISTTVVSPVFFLTSNLVAPQSFLNALVTISFSPSVALSLGQVFGVELSVYNFFTATLIGSLVVANAEQLKHLSNRCSSKLRAKTYVGIPLLGIFLGASCCMSPPILLALVLPAGTLGSVLSKSVATTYVTYYFFPALAAFLLYYSFRGTNRLLEVLDGSTTKRSR